MCWEWRKSNGQRSGRELKWKQLGKKKTKIRLDVEAMACKEVGSMSEVLQLMNEVLKSCGGFSKSMQFHESTRASSWFL